jgi:hypothetical protein
LPADTMLTGRSRNTVRADRKEVNLNRKKKYDKIHYVDEGIFN